MNTNNIELNPSRPNIALSELIPDWQKIKYLQTEISDFNHDSASVALLEKSEDGSTKQWLGFENFFILFRYNRLFYALAVASLADALNECGP